MKICEKCGKKYDDSWKFCLFCKNTLSDYTRDNNFSLQSSSIQTNKQNHRTDKIVKTIILIVIVIGTGLLIFIGQQLFIVLNQAPAGIKYLKSINEEDVQAWIKRTKKYLEEYDHQEHESGEYILSGKSIPLELQKLKIRRIDIYENYVYYVWMGGLDHTYLEVEKQENDTFKITAHYNDNVKPKIIWPK